MTYVGTTYTGYNSVTGTLLVPSGNTNCVIGLSPDSGDGHLVFGTPYASASPGSCMMAGGNSGPLGSTSIVYDPLSSAGCACVYVLEGVSPAIATYSYGQPGYTSTPSIAGAAKIVSGEFVGSGFNLGYANEFCVFVDSPSAVQGYLAQFGTSAPLLAGAPYGSPSGGFGAMAASPAAGQESQPPMLYVVSPASDLVYVFQVQARCGLSLQQTLPTGVDPVGLITADSGTSLFVLDQGAGSAPSSISSYFIQSDGDIQAAGGATFAGSGAVAIGGGDLLGSLYPYFADAGFFYVADGGQSTIDEYSTSNHLPVYVGSIAGTVASGDQASFGAADTIGGGCLGCRYSLNYDEFGLTALSCGTPGTAYSEALALNQGSIDGAGPFALYSGSLPPGLALSVAGVLSGTPSSAGTYAFSVEQDGTASVLTGVFSVTIASAGCTPGTQVATSATSAASTTSVPSTGAQSTATSSPASNASSAYTSASSSSPPYQSSSTASASPETTASGAPPTVGSTSASASASTSTGSSSSASRSAAGSVPEFPFFAAAVIVVTVFVLASYALARRKAASSFLLRPWRSLRPWPARS